MDFLDSSARHASMASIIIDAIQQYLVTSFQLSSSAKGLCHVLHLLPWLTYTPSLDLRLLMHASHGISHVLSEFHSSGFTTPTRNREPISDTKSGTKASCPVCTLRSLFFPLCGYAFLSEQAVTWHLKKERDGLRCIQRRKRRLMLENNELLQAILPGSLTNTAYL